MELQMFGHIGVAEPIMKPHHREPIVVFQEKDH
jgi:hypothetical protein